VDQAASSLGGVVRPPSAGGPVLPRAAPATDIAVARSAARNQESELGTMDEWARKVWKAAQVPEAQAPADIIKRVVSRVRSDIGAFKNGDSATASTVAKTILLKVQNIRQQLEKIRTQPGAALDRASREVYQRSDSIRRDIDAFVSHSPAKMSQRTQELYFNADRMAFEIDTFAREVNNMLSKSSKDLDAFKRNDVAALSPEGQAVIGRVHQVRKNTEQYMKDIILEVSRWAHEVRAIVGHMPPEAVSSS